MCDLETAFREKTIDKPEHINDKEAVDATMDTLRSIKHQNLTVNFTEDWPQVSSHKDLNDELPDFKVSEFEDQVDEEPFGVTKRDEESKSGLSWSDEVFTEDPSGGQRKVQPPKLLTSSSPGLPLSADLTEETSVFDKPKENVARMLIIKCVETLVVTTVVTVGEADED